MTSFNNFDYEIYSNIFSHCGFDLRSIGMVNKNAYQMVTIQVREYAAQIMRKMGDFPMDEFEKRFPKLDYKIWDLLGALSLNGIKTHNMSIYDYAGMVKNNCPKHEEKIFGAILNNLTAQHFPPNKLTKLFTEFVNEPPTTNEKVFLHLNKIVRELSEKEPNSIWDKLRLFQNRKFNEGKACQLIDIGGPHFYFNLVAPKKFILAAKIESVYSNKESTPKHVRFYKALKDNKFNVAERLIHRLSPPQFYKDLSYYHKKGLSINNVAWLVKQTNETDRKQLLEIVLNDYNEARFIDLFIETIDEVVKEQDWVKKFFEVCEYSRFKLSQSSCFARFIDRLKKTIEEDKTFDWREKYGYVLPGVIDLHDNDEIRNSLYSILKTKPKGKRLREEITWLMKKHPQDRSFYSSMLHGIPKDADNG